MSINQALGNAFSGLSAATRASEIVSRNIANASTEGYSATVVNRSQQVNGAHGAGVRVDGIERAGNPLLTADRRRNEAEAGRAEAQAQTLRQLSDIVADPNGGDSLSARYIAFESALRGLADTPESPAMQSTAAAAGRALANRFQTISTETGRMRGSVEGDVGRQVRTVNTALNKIAHLNTQIAAAAATGRDTTALEDERDRQIDTVNDIVPINARDRDEGGMVISTRGGALLVEGSVREISVTGVVEQVDGSEKYVFTIDGEREGIIREALGPSGALSGGTLEASVTALMEDIPAFEAQVDELAKDLIVRFQNLPGYNTVVVDDLGAPILVAGEEQPLAGLFTVDGGRFDEAGDATGLAGKITFNVNVDPRETGGDASLLRTGLFAGGLTVDTSASPAAEPFPTAIMTALRESRASQVPQVAGNFNAVDLAVGLVGMREVNAASAEGEASYQQAAVTSLRDKELALSAVDTDQELRDLLRIEQAYQANARVLDAANTMINRLLEI